MAENTPKKVLSGQVRIPEDLDREIDLECSRRGMFKYELIQELWDNRPGAPPKKDAPRTIAGLDEARTSLLLEILNAKEGTAEYDARAMLVGFIDMRLRQRRRK